MQSISFIFYRISTNPFLIRILIFFSVLLWVSGLSILPLTGGSPFGEVIAFFFKPLYGSLCHQIDFKLPDIFGFKLLVCSRCSGIYFGVALASLFSLFYLPAFSNTKLLLFSALPLLIDVVLVNLGIYSYSHLISFLTGLLSGSVLFIYILSAFENFLLNITQS